MIVSSLRGVLALEVGRLAMFGCCDGGDFRLGFVIFGGLAGLAFGGVLGALIDGVFPDVIFELLTRLLLVSNTEY